MKNARIVESVRGAKGGYQLREPPSEIRLSEIIRLIDGPLAPFGDAEHLRELIDRNDNRRALYEVFLEVRDAAAKILDEHDAGRSGAEPCVGQRQERRRQEKCGSERVADGVDAGGQAGHD